MLQIVKQPENGGAGYVLVAVMDGDPGKWMTLVFDKSFNSYKGGETMRVKVRSV